MTFLNSCSFSELFRSRLGLRIDFRSSKVETDFRETETEHRPQRDGQRNQERERPKRHLEVHSTTTATTTTTTSTKTAATTTTVFLL